MEPSTSMLALPVDMLKHVTTELSTADALSFRAICRDMVRRLEDVGMCGEVYRCIGNAVDGEGTVEPCALTALIGRIRSLPFGLRPVLLRAVTLRAANVPAYQRGQAYRQFWWMRQRWYDALRAPANVLQRRAINAWTQCIQDTDRHLRDDASRVVRETGLRDLFLAQIYAPLLKVETHINNATVPITDVAAALPMRDRLAVIDCLLTVHPSSDVPRVLLEIDAMFDRPLLWAAEDDSAVDVSAFRTRSLSPFPPRLLHNLIDTLMASTPNVELRTRCLTSYRIDARYLREHVDPYVANWIAEQGMFLADAGASPTGFCPYPWSQTLEQQLAKWHPGYDNAFARHLHEAFVDAIVVQSSWGHSPAVAQLPDAVRDVLRDRVLSLSPAAVYALGQERDTVSVFWSLYVRLEHDDMSLDALDAWASIMRQPWQLQAVLVERWSRRMSPYVQDKVYARAYLGCAETVLEKCIQWERELSVRCGQAGEPALAVRVVTASVSVQAVVARCREKAAREEPSGATPVVQFDPYVSEMGRANLLAMRADAQITFLAVLHVSGAATRRNAHDAGWGGYLRERLENLLSDPSSRLRRPSSAVMSFLCARIPDLWDSVADAHDATRTRVDRLLERLELAFDMRTVFRSRLSETLGSRVAAGQITMAQAVESIAAPGETAAQRALSVVIEALSQPSRPG